MLPSYLQALSEYSRVLSQRSCLLRDSREHAALLDTLEIWDMHLVQYGAYILSVRKRFVGKLQHHAAEIYSGLAGNTEKLSLQLASTIDGTEEDDRKLLEQRFMEKLHQNRAEDLRLGTTGVGIHRDDVDILIDGKHARSYGSQGQQRSCVLALKLAESGILQEKMGENPIILLDDVMSELDHHRRDFLLNYLGDRQVWMTCCDPQYFFSLKNGKTMRMEHGRLIGA